MDSMQFPMMPMMPMAPTGADAASLPAMIDMLKQEFGVAAPPAPIYRRGFKIPPRPTLAKIEADSLTAMQNNQSLIWRMYNDVMWYRMAYVGMFPEDVEQRELGFDMDEFRDPSMAQELEIVSWFLAGLPFRPQKRILDQRYKAEASQFLDVIRYWREMAEQEHEENGMNAPLAIEEGKFLTIFGRVVNRSTANVIDPERPIRQCLIDPTTFFPVYAGYRGMIKGYHIYQAPIGQVLGDYNDIPASEMKKLKNDYGEQFDEGQLVKCIEYWDEWYRATIIPSCTILPVTEHKYGEVPFTIGMGPSGEPGAMRMPQFAPAWERSEDMVAHQPTLGDNVYKGLSYIHYMRVEHEQFEAIMARMIRALKIAVNPPTILEQTNEAKKAVGRPPLDLSPGAVNELILGEQKWNPVPTQPTPLQIETLMNALMRSKGITRLPDAFLGNNDKSNVSGTSMQNMSGAGLEKLGSWVMGLEYYHSHVYTKNARLFRNFGYLSKYVGDEITPIMVPSTRKNTSPFEVTPELIEHVRPEVKIKLQRARREEWMALGQTFNQFDQLGIMTKDMMVQELGWDYDYDDIEEEWTEQKATEMALSNPDFATFFTIPSLVAKQIDELEGKPEQQRWLRAALDNWMHYLAQPKMQELSMQQQQMGGMMGGGMPQLPQGQAPQNPPTAANVSYPQLNQGPGSVTGQQGGPTPPPPGSVQIGPPARRP